MELERLFSLSSSFALPFWALMIVLPHWRVTKWIIGSPFIAVVPATIYALLVLPDAAAIYATVSNPSLAGIAALLGSPVGATIGWAHFLAFDLLIGRWAYLDSRERKISALLMAPILYLTLMLGPIGFLLYLALRSIYSLYARFSGASAAITAQKPI
jgi:hypothetical protein